MPRRKKNYRRDEITHDDDISESSGNSQLNYRQSSLTQLLLPNAVFTPNVAVSGDIADPSGLRSELSYFFLSPMERWKHIGEFSITFLIHMLKLIFVTSQLLLFGSLSATRISYIDRAEVSFKHAYLMDWDPQYETLPYPPSTGTYAVYSRQQFYSTVAFALRNFNSTESTSINGYVFSESSRRVRICTSQFPATSVSTPVATDNFDTVTVCKFINLVDTPDGALDDRDRVKELLDTNGLSIDFTRFYGSSIDFSLRSPPTHHGDWDRSIECFQFDIQILFDNSGQTGQVLIRLHSDLTEVQCTSGNRTNLRFSSTSSTGHRRIGSEKASRVRLLVHVAIDLLALNTALVSSALSIAALVRAVRLWKRTLVFFVGYYGIRLRSTFFEFFNPWHVGVILSDAFIAVGSTFKLVNNTNLLDVYSELSYILGLGTLMVWISILNYARISSHTDLLLRTIRRAVPSLLRFCICALILYFAFALSAWVIIGPFHVKFRSFTSTLECLFSLLNGDDMYVTFSIIDRSKGLAIFLFSRIFLYLFITLFIYVVLNIFVTIIFEAYEDVKEPCRNRHSESRTLIERFLSVPNQPINDQAAAVDENSLPDTPNCQHHHSTTPSRSWHEVSTSPTSTAPSPPARQGSVSVLNSDVDFDKQGHATDGDS